MIEHSSTGPLKGLRVVEMGSFIAGPFCGQLLADLDAEVIKIEPPKKGDAMRQWGAVRHNGHSLWWPIIARNKRSLALDLRQPDGRAIVQDLIRKADILVENFRPGTLEKWGMAPDDLIASNPGLIVARVSGFGQTGPMAHLTGFGAIAEAMAGMRNLAGHPDRPPVRAGLSLGDSLAGMFACIGILAALRARAETGRGQVVDIGITDAVLAVSESVIAEYSATGAIRTRAGTALPKIAPSNIYPTLDGEWVLIAANADAIFARLAEAMGRPELANDARFSSHHARGEHQDLLDGIIADWTATMSRAEILERMEAHSVPAGPICNAADVAAMPHFRAREAIIDVETKTYGALSMQGVVPRLSQTPGSIRWVGPELGEHTDEILSGDLGLAESAIAGLRAGGVI